MQPVTWVHVSDLHAGQPGEPGRWGQAQDLVLRDLEAMQSELGPPDAIFFTGDLAFAGTAEDYRLVDGRIDTLLSMFKEPPPLVVVPGNHDLLRPDGNEVALPYFHELTQSARRRELGVVDSSAQLFLRTLFQNFDSWWRSRILADWQKRGLEFVEGLYPGDFALRLLPDAAPFGVVGLNSALVHFDGRRAGDLVVLQEQMSQRSFELSSWLKQQPANLVLMHHPVDWLDSLARKAFLSDIYSLPDTSPLVACLHGHMHETASMSVSGSSGLQRQYLQAASLFGLEYWGTQAESRAIGYSWGRLEYDDAGVPVRVTCWPRDAVPSADGSWSFRGAESFKRYPTMFELRRTPHNVSSQHSTRADAALSFEERVDTLPSGLRDALTYFTKEVLSKESDRDALMGTSLSQRASVAEGSLSWLLGQAGSSLLTDYEVILIACSFLGSAVGLTMASESIRDLGAGELPSEPSARFYYLRENSRLLSSEVVKKALTVASTADSNLTGLVTVLQGIVGQSSISPGNKIPEFIPVASGAAPVRARLVFALSRLAELLVLTDELVPSTVLLGGAEIEYGDYLDLRNSLRMAATRSPADESILVNVVTDDISAFAHAAEHARRIDEALRSARTEDGRVRHWLPDLLSCQYDVPFCKRVIRFGIEPIAAFDTLVGRNLYQDAKIFVRELFQNALDATTARCAIDGGTQARIAVEYDSMSRILTIVDNGIGMSIHDVETKLTKACSSGFRQQPASDKLIARFGIGFLSVFLVSETIEILTRHLSNAENDGLLLSIHQRDKPIRVEPAKAPVGTTVRVWVDPSIKLDESDLQRWLPASQPGTVITCRFDGKVLQCAKRTPGETAWGPFEEYTSERDGDGFHLVFRAHVSPERGVGERFICGLGFQDKAELPEQIIEVPSPWKRFFVRGVPFLPPGRQKPSHPQCGYSNGINALFSLSSFPIDLHVDTPGRLELTLDRTTALKSQRNDSLFSEIDEALVVEVLRFFGQYPQPRIAGQLISDCWLLGSVQPYVQLIRRRRHPSSKEISEALRPVFDRCLVLVAGNSQATWEEFGKVRERAKVFAFLGHALKIKVRLQDVVSLLRRALLDWVCPGGEFAIILDLCRGALRQPVSSWDFFLSHSKGFALLDLGLPQLDPVSLFSEDASVLQYSDAKREIACYGCPRPLIGLRENYIGYHHRSGGPYHIRFNSFSTLAKSERIRAALYDAQSDIVFPRSPRRDILDEWCQKHFGFDFDAGDFAEYVIRGPV